jgi:transcription antitermination factor NusG
MEKPPAPKFAPVERSAAVAASTAATNLRHAADKTPSHRWYTLSVITTAQTRVCRRAHELGFETYFPVSKIPARPAKLGRKSATDEVRPLMPGYVFVSLPIAAPRFDLFASADVNGSRPYAMPDSVYAGYVADCAEPMVEPICGCLGFIATDGVPNAVRDEEIAALRLREANGEFDLTGRSEDGRYSVARWVKRDAFVRFVKGPFAMFSGVIDRVVGRNLVSVELTIFGRITTSTVPMDWIERA